MIRTNCRRRWQPPASTIAMVAACFALLSAGVLRAAGRPNVLWICADDHAPYVYGAYGNRQVHTPRLDQLAGEGMRFARAYCNSPVCTASRQSFLTGRYPHSVGVTLLKTALPESETTLAEMLEDAGYRTAAIGKMHFNSPLTHGFQTRIDLPDYQRALAARHRERIPESIDILPTWKPFADQARIWLNSFCRPYGATDADMNGTYFAAEAVRHLNAAGEQPFFLMVSFYEPHSPFHFPIEYRGRHNPTSMQLPDVGPEDDEQIPTCFRDLTHDEKQGIIAAYYTSVEFLDQNVGRVLDGLAAAGLADDTLVIYTGDHGYMLGQHGRFEKHCFYEPAVRAPLVMRLPGRVREGSVTPALVEFIDIVPTVLELCGLPLPESVAGRSLVKLFNDPAATHRDCIFGEYAENEEALIRTDRWKLVYTTGRRQRTDGYATGRPLTGKSVHLFDTLADPEELTNLAARPEHTALVDELMQRLADHMRGIMRRPVEIPAGASADLVLERCLPPMDE